MKSIFSRPAPVATEPGHPPSAPEAASVHDCLAAPAVLSAGARGDRVVKVETALRAGDYVVVAGWAVGDLSIRVGDAPTSTPADRFERPDVAAHFQRSPEERHGWVIVATLPRSDADVGLLVLDGDECLLSQTLPLSPGESADAAAAALLGPAAGLLAHAYEPFSPEWKACVRQRPAATESASRARGFLEAAIDVRGTGHTVVVGWAVAPAGTVMWLEDGRGGIHPLEGAARVARPDVHALLGSDFGGAALASGFKALLRLDAGAGRLELKALDVHGIRLLGAVECTEIAPSPLVVARWLFGIAVTDGAHDERYDAVAGPLLSDLIARDRQHWQGMPVVRRSLGCEVADPEVSLVIPLYGRFDFVESQMVEWARDPWIRANAELVYVIDDPALVESFRPHAEELHRLYGVPFRWVWGGLNRGFSGASNLGALEARAPRLLFLNSDVFPQHPGWLQAMVLALDGNPDVGAVGPRLLFAEGGIQHAGMRFERLEEFGVWINRHTSLGLDPSLDPARGPSRVPALTGACLLVRTADFEAVGGWDTGYLVGDFEDSDLCLKLRERGLTSLYLPDVQLTHLERQSMSALGDDAFRVRVTLWNAMRHQRRWDPLIRQAMEACA